MSLAHSFPLLLTNLPTGPSSCSASISDTFLLGRRHLLSFDPEQTPFPLDCRPPSLSYTDARPSLFFLATPIGRASSPSSAMLDVLNTLFRLLLRSHERSTSTFLETVLQRRGLAFVRADGSGGRGSPLGDEAPPPILDQPTATPSLSFFATRARRDSSAPSLGEILSAKAFPFP